MNSSYHLERQRLYDSCHADINDNDFWVLAKAIYDFQLRYNVIFHQYVSKVQSELRNQQFYFLPISSFKSHEIKTGLWQEEKLFYSSGTVSQVKSQHFVKSLDQYLQNTQKIFEHHFKNISNYCFLCLLPSYLERDGSSLIEMCDNFIIQSRFALSGFYLYDHESLNKAILRCEEENIPTILLGVSYALLDFSENFQYESLQHVRIMKTGGMKGRRREIAPAEFDKLLVDSLGTEVILAEYGMTECFSQMYSDNGHSYAMNPSMKARISDLTDPFSFLDHGRTGRINIADLANIDTCSFIATDDVGYISEDGKLIIVGRIDNSDLRGCNMLL